MLPSVADLSFSRSSGRVKLRGALDLAEGPGLEAVLGQFVQLDHIVVDLSEATYVDSTVLGCLCSLKKQIVLNGHTGTISISGASRNVKRIFEITGLSKVFEIQNVDMDAMSFEIEATYTPSSV